MSRQPQQRVRYQKVPTSGKKRRLHLSTNRYWVLGIALLVVALLGGTFLIGRNSSRSSVAASGLPVGSTAPAFSGRNVLTGRVISTKSLAGKNVLYYFSSGSSCQACMVQAQALQQSTAMLAKAHMSLVMVTNDSASALVAAASAYKLTLPLVADPHGMLTTNFGAVGGGMDMGAGMADHSFILVDKTGMVRFHKDFPNMWITTSALLKQLPNVS